jgi:PPOX class probable F420-dependent enzyme
VRHDETEGARTITLVPALEPLVHQQYVLLTTYRRDGTPVGTPVHIAVDGDRAFVRTWDTAWKLKRIRNNPEVEVAPSTMRGVPTGSAVHARARVLEAPRRRTPPAPLPASIRSCTAS